MARLMGETPSQIGPMGGHWVAMAFINTNHNNHWLEVSLTGPPGNQQGLGARMTVQTGNKRQVGQVGHAESSRFSQGHYRSYFVLGKKLQVDAFTVAWPDGSLQTVPDVQVDQVITVNWSDRKVK